MNEDGDTPGDNTDSEDAEVVPFPGPVAHPSSQRIDQGDGPDMDEEQFDLDFTGLDLADEEEDRTEDSSETPVPDDEAPQVDGDGEEPKDDQSPTEAPPAKPFDLEEEDTDRGSSLEDYTSKDYVRATTKEYEGLAKAVEEAESEDHPKQAFAVAVPGMEAGVVGFEDVTGEKKETHTGERSDLPLRIGSALLLAAIFVGALFTARGWLAALAVAVVVAALVEFYSTARKAGFNPMALLGLLGAVAVMGGAWFAGGNELLVASGLSAVSVGVVMLWYVLTGMKRPLENGGMTILGVLWVALLMAFTMPIIRAEEYQALVIFIVVVSATMDIASYFVGRALGRTPLAPVLSPKKTVEGFVGGVLVAMGLAIGMSTLDFFDMLEFSDAAILSAVIVGFAVLGDLMESLVKRSLGVKDMGSVIPGHGGLLDRVDGLIFVFPAAYYALLWLDLL